MSNRLIVVMLEKAEGNAEIGTAWIETATFSEHQLIRDILAWAERRGWPRPSSSTRPGRLMLDVTDQNHVKRT